MVYTRRSAHRGGEVAGVGMQDQGAQTHIGDQQTTSRRRDAVTPLLLAAVSAILFVPQLATDPEDFPAGLNLAWLLLLLSAAPVAAFILTRHRGRLSAAQQWIVSLSQLAITVALVRLDTWLEVRSGYLLAGSSEVAMSYGIGLVLSLVAGSVLAFLVAVGAQTGGRRPAVARTSRSTRSGSESGSR